MERFTLAAGDGFQIAAARWLPGGPPRAVLQLCHGMSEHVARYAPLAEACAAAGIAVYGHDHRGHGASVDEDTPLGHFADQDGWETVLSDVQLVHESARGSHPSTPVFLLGHSMGAFIARTYLLRDAGTLAGAIISAPGWRMGPLAAGLERIAKREARKRGARTPSPLMTRLVFGSFNIQFMPARTRFDWLSRDPDAVDAYVADPLCGFDCSGRLWADLLAAARSLEIAEDDRDRLSSATPLMIFAGSRDPVSMGGLGSCQLAARYRAAGNPDVTVARYRGARHEVLNETIRAESFGDILGWLNRQIDARPAGVSR